MYNFTPCTVPGFTPVDAGTRCALRASLIEPRTWLNIRLLCVGLAAIASAAKWVAVKDGQLHTTGEAREILMEVREDEPLNLLTVFGAAKCGKSFLMNALTGFDNMFPVSPGVTPCTAGADLSPILMPLSSFRRGGGRTDNSPVVSASPEPTIVFSDMEGQGDQSAEHDTRLAIPFLLLSQASKPLFNIPPSKNPLGSESSWPVGSSLVLIVCPRQKYIHGEVPSHPLTYWGAPRIRVETTAVTAVTPPPKIEPRVLLDC